MKIFIPLLFFIFSSAYGATCTLTSRTNYSTGQVLTSSALNADFNQLVTKVNSLDGGCVTDGTLEASALNATDFAAVTNGIHQGCLLSYTDANTVSVGKCIASVNGNFIKTATASTVTWGCSGCSSELSATQYYVYAKTGSSGTSLNLLISTTAPGEDGYDALGDKILGRFYNNGSSAIVQNSVDSWQGNKFSTSAFDFSVNYGATDSITKCTSGTCFISNQEYPVVSVVRTASTGVYDITLSRPFTSISCSGYAAVSTTVGGLFVASNTAAASPVFEFVTMTTSSVTADTFGTVHCRGY